MKVLILLSNSSEKVFYKPIISLFKKEDLKIEYFIFTWKHKTQEDCAKEIISFYKTNDLSQYYIFGFSISAFIAILVAKEINVRGLILVSPTPLFSDTNYPKWVKKYLGIKRLAITKQTNLIDLPHKSKKTFLLVGENEDSEMLRQSSAFTKAHRNVTFIKIKNTGHELNTYDMLTGLKQTIILL